MTGGVTGTCSRESSSKGSTEGGLPRLGRLVGVVVEVDEAVVVVVLMKVVIMVVRD